MSLRRKTILAVLGALLVVVVAVSWAMRVLLLERFARLEEQDSHQNAERALAALSDEVAYLADQTEDYAYWDRLYAAVERRDQGFFGTELPSAAQSALRIHLVVLMDSEGRVVFGKSLDLEQRKDGPLPASLEEHLKNPRLRVRRDGGVGVEGILLLPEGPALVATRPVLPARDQGPAHGTLVLARYLDAWQIEKLVRHTRFTLTFSPFEDPRPAGDIQWARSRLSERSRIVARPRTDDVVAGYALIEDIYGGAALVLRAEGYRRIYKEGQTSVAYLTASVILVGLASAVVCVLLLETLLLRPLGRLEGSRPD